jgi:predicted nucleotidyltransferase
MEYGLDGIRYYKLTDRKKKEVIERVTSMLNVDERVKLAFVFGSFTRRESLRDIDLAVYAGPSLSFDELLSLGAKMEMELNLPFDLVQLQDLDPEFRLKVLRYASRILVKDKQLHQKLVALSFDELLSLKMHKSTSSGAIPKQ